MENRCPAGNLGGSDAAPTSEFRVEAPRITALLSRRDFQGSQRPNDLLGSCAGKGEFLIDVLVVDDEPGISRIVRLMLESEGLSVEVRDSGATALEFVESKEVRLVLLDLNMPVMDGLEFFRQLRQRGFTTPVIIMSAHGARRAAREIGAEAYLDKPFMPADLIARIEKLM